MALLLFDGDLIKLKCIKQEISLCTIRALFHKKPQLYSHEAES